MWARLTDPESQRLSYLLLGASQEFGEDGNHDVEAIFNKVVEDWRNQGESVFVQRFHYAPYANSTEGVSGILSFLRRKEEGFGY